MILAGLLCWHTPGFTQTKLDQETYCLNLERQREGSAKSGNSARIDELARLYVQSCRQVRSKPEVSIAMAEIASVKRLLGYWSEALFQAQECIRFEYLALDCHIEKALALDGLGMKSEAKQVLRTAGDVVGQLETIGSHELASAEAGRSRLRPGEYEQRERRARARLSMAANGRVYLKAIQVAFGVA